LVKGGLGLHSGPGYNKSFFVDLGLAYTRSGRVGHHPFQSAAFLANETYFGKSVYVAPKIGVWAAGGPAIGAGASLLYFTDFSQARMVLRPEFGFGAGRFRIYYGYNIKFGSKGFNDFNKSAFGINLWWNKQVG
jgi:hypothetical protein